MKLTIDARAALAHVEGAELSDTSAPALYDGDPLRVLAQAVRACSDLHVQATDAYADAARDHAGLSRNAMRRVERMAEDAHEAIGHVLVALRSMMRAAPKVD